MSRSRPLVARYAVSFAFSLADRSGRDRVLGQPTVSALSPPLATPRLVPEAVGRVRASEASRDEELVAAVRRGDRNAEEMLYRRYAPSILGLATRLLRSHDEAMDVLQDVFVTTFDDLAKLREPAAFRGWAHQICVRLVHRRFRKRRLWALLGLYREGEEVALDSLADERASPEARMELQWLNVALARIDERARAAWMLRTIEGLSLDEIAEASSCSLATVKRRIAKVEGAVAAHFHEEGKS